MAIYDVSAELVITVIVERQATACNHIFAEREVAKELARYRPTLPDGAAYDVQVNDVTATPRKTK